MSRLQSCIHTWLKGFPVFSTAVLSWMYWAYAGFTDAWKTRGRRFKQFGLSQLWFDWQSLVWPWSAIHSWHRSLWVSTQSAKRTTYSIAHDEIAGVSRLSRENSWLKQWPQEHHKSITSHGLGLQIYSQSEKVKACFLAFHTEKVYCKRLFYKPLH